MTAERELIEKQDKLIEFYAERLSANAMFLHIHHMTETPENSNKGQKLRDEISALKSSIESEKACEHCDEPIPCKLECDINTPFFGNSGAKVPLEQSKGLTADEFIFNHKNYKYLSSILNKNEPNKMYMIVSMLNEFANSRGELSDSLPVCKHCGLSEFDYK